MGGPGESWERETGAVCYREVVLDAPPVAESRKVVAALQQEIERLLQKEGCMTGGGGEVSPCDGFLIRYGKGSTDGDICVHTLRTEDDPPDRWRLLILIHESVKYGPTAH